MRLKTRTYNFQKSIQDSQHEQEAKEIWVYETCLQFIHALPRLRGLETLEGDFEGFVESIARM